MFEELTQTIVSFVRDSEGLAVPLAFAVAFGESFCFLSMLWPGTAILVGIAGVLAASGVSSAIVLPMVIAAAAGGFLGYAISYWIGYYFKDSIHTVWPFSKNPDYIRKGEYFFQKYGAWSVFLGHFFGPIRAVIPVVAGMFAMRQWPFQIANAASSALWAGGVITSAFFAVTYIDEIFALLKTHEAVVAAIMFCLAVVVALPQSMIFWPVLIILIIIGFIQLYAGGDFWPLLLATAGGAFVGDLICYALGKQRRADLLNLRFLKGQVQAVDKATDTLEHDGVLSIVPSKFGSLSRALVPMIAGAKAVHPAAFATVSLISSLAWAAVLLAPYVIFSFIGH